MEIIDLLAIRLINDLKQLNNQLKELCDVLSKSKRETNPYPLPPSEREEQANDKNSQ
jgi:hypothetical protein